MCGRYSLVTNQHILEKRFAFSAKELNLESQFNVAPTHPVLTVLRNPTGIHAKIMRWGLIPYWTKDKISAKPLINARTETLIKRPGFKNSFINKRCLILTDGYYEWTQTPRGKQPVR